METNLSSKPLKDVKMHSHASTKQHIQLISKQVNTKTVQTQAIDDFTVRNDQLSCSGLKGNCYNEMLVGGSTYMRIVI